MKLLLFLVFFGLDFAARVEFFSGKIAHGLVFTKDGMVSVESQNGTHQYKMSMVKSIRASSKQWLCKGELIELKKEANDKAEILLQLTEGTSVREAGGVENGFRKVKVYDEVGYIAEKALTKIITHTKLEDPIVEFNTTKGTMQIQLFEDDCPNTVANFIHLIEKNFYSALTFHRRDEGFIVQGGDPEGTGEGGPGYHIRAETVAGIKNLKGYVGMADSGMDTGGSQFYILLADAPHLDGRYTVFGKIISNPKLPSLLDVGDEIVSAKVIKKRDHAYLPETIAVNR